MKDARSNIRYWENEMVPALKLCRLEAAAAGERVLRRKGPEETPDLPTLATALSELFRKEQSKSPAAIGLRTEMALSFCRSVLSLRPEYGATSAPPPFRGRPARILCFENPFANRAHLRFQPLFPATALLFAPSFSAAIEELSNGSGDFAILPVYDSAQGRLSGLVEQIERAGLHLSHTVNIPYSNDARQLRYALLSRDFTPPGRLRGQEVIELSFTAQGIPSDLFTAASAAGLSLFSLDTRPVPGRPERLFFSIAFSVPPRTGPLFSLYLSLCQPHVDLNARYIHLSEEQK